LTKAAKVVLVIVIGFIVVLGVSVASDIAKEPQRQERFDEIYAQCVEQNDDIMSHQAAIDHCDQIVEDAKLFS
jgi:hypothetical protein